MAFPRVVFVTTCAGVPLCDAFTFRMLILKISEVIDAGYLQMVRAWRGVTRADLFFIWFLPSVNIRW
jgi:hypothetical protein